MIVTIVTTGPAKRDATISEGSGNFTKHPELESVTERPAYQRLKYRALPDFFGRSLAIPAFEAIEKTLLYAMAPALPAEFVLRSDASHIAMLMSKYGALDLTFAASSPVLTSDDTITWEQLRKLGLADQTHNLAEEFEWVEKSLHEEQCFLRVFLTWVLPLAAMDLRDQQVRAEIAKGTPPHLAYDVALDHLARNIAQRFPISLTVDDACLTNSESIWVVSNFYL